MNLLVSSPFHLIMEISGNVTARKRDILEPGEGGSLMFGLGCWMGSGLEAFESRYGRIICN